MVNQVGLSQILICKIAESYWSCCIESYALCMAKSTSLCTSDDDIDTLLVLDGAVFQADASKGTSSGGSGGDKS